MRQFTDQSGFFDDSASKKPKGGAGAQEGRQEEVALHGHMTIPPALCVYVWLHVHIPEPMAQASGCWYEGKRFKSGQDVHVCVIHSLQHSLWISLLSEGGPNILTVQGLLPGVSECECVLVCCCSVLAGHWLPIHKLGIPRWKRYVCVCLFVSI